MPSQYRTKQLENTLRRIRNNMLKGDDAYDYKAQRVIGLIKQRLVGVWKDRYNSIVENRLERMG